MGRASKVLLVTALLWALLGGYICFSPVPGEFTYSFPGVYCMLLYGLLMLAAFRAQRNAFLKPVKPLATTGKPQEQDRNLNPF